MKREKILTNKWILAAAAVSMVILTCSPARAAVEWSEGAVINNPSISKPTSGQKFGLNTTVECTCNTPTDSDDWCDEEEQTSGSTPDAKIEATWSDGGAGGSWVGNDNKGASVKYITPSSTGEVELTVTFDDADTVQYPDTSKNTNVTIEVVAAKMIFKVGGEETSSITRAGTGSFEVVDDEGDTIDGATYSNWKFDGQVDVTSDNTARTWSGTIVEPGTASCTVTFGETICTVSKTITVIARTGWEVDLDFDSDVSHANPRYSFPSNIVAEYGCSCNQTIIESSPDFICFFVITHNVLKTKYEDNYTTAEVSSGPNKDVWYISAEDVKIHTRSLVNHSLEANDTDYQSISNPPPICWDDRMIALGEPTIMLGLRAGIVAHEGYGDGDPPRGHQRHLETQEASGDDAAAAIEDKVHESKAQLESLAYSTIDAIAEEIGDEWDDEPDTADQWNNWGPGKIAIWYDNSGEWVWAIATINYGGLPGVGF
ncbi:MAG: hypothetical protein KAV87_19295 [Desulfobacteraceae bacterium]|nr:hypothetical protein [Desulfobacteraceae bacterium]